MSNMKFGKLTGALIGAWFLVSLAASALHVFDTDPNRPPLPFGLAVVIPIGLFLLWYAVSKDFRHFVLNLDPRVVTLAHSWRLAGFAFLALYAYGLLPGLFALPAGWGDIAIGATAPFVALRLANPRHRRSFIVWQVLGILDLVLAIAFGTTARLIEPHSIATSAMTILPMSLIPTFAVPLLLILHIISIAQARRWPERWHAGAPEQIPSPAL